MTERTTFIERQKQAFGGWMKGNMFMPDDGKCYHCKGDVIQREIERGNDGSQGVTGCPFCMKSYCD